MKGWVLHIWALFSRHPSFLLAAIMPEFLAGSRETHCHQFSILIICLGRVYASSKSGISVSSASYPSGHSSRIVTYSKQVQLEKNYRFLRGLSVKVLVLSSCIWMWEEVRLVLWELYCHEGWTGKWIELNPNVHGSWLLIQPCLKLPTLKLFSLYVLVNSLFSCLNLCESVFLSLIMERAIADIGKVGVVD